MEDEKTTKAVCFTEVQSRAKLNKYKVLLVDDEPLVLFAIKSMLVKLNCDVITATNGATAVEMLKATNKYGNEEGIQLVILDANMPIMNGYQTATTITELMHNCAITPVKMVCLSAQDPATHAVLCASSGMEEVCMEYF